MNVRKYANCMIEADSRRRDHTASESETESSKRQRPFTARSTPALSALATPSRVALAQVVKRHSSPAKLGPEDDNKTVHAAARGAGWVEGPAGERDGLDEVISGVQHEELGEDDDNEGSTNPNPKADSFKCGQSHDGSAPSGPNEWLASKFDEFHAMYSGSKHKNSFQIRGYMLGECQSRLRCLADSRRSDSPDALADHIR